MAVCIHSISVHERSILSSPADPPRDNTTNISTKPQRTSQAAATTATTTDNQQDSQDPHDEQDDDDDEEDEILVALHRIHSHITNPKKFKKASELLRRLLSTQGALDQQRHGTILFDILSSSMEHPRVQVHNSDLASEYSKLFKVASKHAEALFTSEQRSQLDVYGIVAVLRHDLVTADDGFALSRTINTIKRMIVELDGTGTDSVGTTTNTNIRDRSHALALCVAAGKEIYPKLWARTFIDMLVDFCMQDEVRTRTFGDTDQALLADMARFVEEQKRGRGGGRALAGGKEATVTSFERDRQAWEKRDSVSHRGNVGGQGDRKTTMWS